MTWGELFERASSYDIDIEAVRETVEHDRGDDDSDR